VQNDTYGEMSRDELAAMRASAKSCLTCGMLADIDPIAHESRYGHAPVVADGTGRLVWSSDRFSWIADTPAEPAGDWPQYGTQRDTDGTILRGPCLPCGCPLDSGCDSQHIL
jgi:hypothetical protein